MSTTTMRVPCGCKAILSEEDPRAEIWRNVFGCLEFPLCSPMPLMGKAEGELESRFLRGDWSALSPEQQQKLCQEMIIKFGIDDHVFRMQNQALGYVPINDQNITVVVCQLHTRMMI